MDGVDGVLILLVTPCVLPVSATDGPRAEADGGDVKVGVAKLMLCSQFLCAHACLDAARAMRVAV